MIAKCTMSCPLRSSIEYGSAVGDEISVTEMSKCEGEARANNRKAKLIFFYEWDIEFKWKTKKDKVSTMLLNGRAKACVRGLSCPYRTCLCSTAANYTHYVAYGTCGMGQLLLISKFGS